MLLQGISDYICPSNHFSNLEDPISLCGVKRILLPGPRGDELGPIRRLLGVGEEGGVGGGDIGEGGWGELFGYVDLFEEFYRYLGLFQSNKNVVRATRRRRMRANRLRCRL